VAEASFTDQSRGQAIGFLIVPADLLPDSAQLRLELGGDPPGEVSAGTLDERGIDHAARRTVDADLEACDPSCVELSEERLDHGGLESIDQTRPVPSEESDAEVCAEGDADRRQRIEACTSPTRLDPSKV
jgi:hypothetical protein